MKHLPSATFNTRPLCQLIRIHKTPTVSLMRSVSVPDLDELSDEDEMQDKRPESRLVKSTIGEFYDDKKYLEKLASISKPSRMYLHQLFFFNNVYENENLSLSTCGAGTVYPSGAPAFTPGL